jgi:hypothetical protein
MGGKYSTPTSILQARHEHPWFSNCTAPKAIKSNPDDLNGGILRKQWRNNAMEMHACAARHDQVIERLFVKTQPCADSTDLGRP